METGQLCERVNPLIDAADRRFFFRAEFDPDLEEAALSPAFHPNRIDGISDAATVILTTEENAFLINHS